MTTTKTYTITVNKGNAAQRTEVVKPLKVSGTKTLVAYIRGASIATRWVASSRITTADQG